MTSLYIDLRMSGVLLYRIKTIPILIKYIYYTFNFNNTKIFTSHKFHLLYAHFLCFKEIGSFIIADHRVLD